MKKWYNNLLENKKDNLLIIIAYTVVMITFLFAALRIGGKI